MKTICLVRFGTEVDNNVSLTIGLLSVGPVSYAMKAEGVIVTIFKTDQSIDRCRKSLQRHGYNFILLDITNDSCKIPVSGHGVNALNALINSDLELSQDQREKRLFDKIRALGNDALTEDEHNFLKSRM